MASNYTRKINLYVNVDGKEVSNNVRSIRAEMVKLMNAQKNMTIGSDEYVAQTKKIQYLKGILNKHQKDVANVGKSWSFKGIAEGFNKYVGIIVAGIASVIGVVYKMNQAIEASNAFEDKLANLSAITGLTGNQLEWLGNKAKEMSTSTLEGGINITKSADDIVEAFTKMGSARPELLKNKEALAQVTEQALILAEAGKLDLEVSISAVAAAMNQFNLDATQSGQIINTMAAGSLEGSAEIQDLTGSLKNVGTVAADSNMTLEQTVAALEVLAEKQLKGEEAGTKLRGALLKMKDAGVGYTSGSFNMRDAIVDINTKLEGMGSNLEKDAYKAKVFGIENITAGNVLLQNVDKYDKLTTAITGTNVAMEQAAKNTNTNTALMAQAKNEFHNASIELGKNLSPAMTVLYQLAGSVAKEFSHMIATSPAESLEKEGRMVNSLATELANSNTPLKRRQEILTELKTIHPDIVTGLDAENLNYKTLTTNLQAYNNELSNRILLENLSEDEKKYAAQSAKYKEQFADAQIKINEIIAQTDKDIAFSNATMEEKTEKTLEILKSKAAGVLTVVSGAVVDGRNEEAKALLRLQGWIERSTDAQKNLNEAQGQQIDFSNRVKQLKEILGIQDEINNDGNNVNVNNGNPLINPINISGDPDTTKSASDALEYAYKEQQLLLKDRYEGEETLQKEFHARMLANDLAFILAKQALATDDNTYLDLQSQYNDKQREYTAAIKEAAPQILLTRDEIEKLNSGLLEESKLLNLAKQNQEEGTAAQEKAIAKHKQQAETIKMVGDVMTDYVTGVLDGSVDEFQTFGDTLILMSLQILKQMVPIWSAQILGLSLSSPESVATWGVAGMAKYVAITGLMYAGIAAAEGVVKSGINKRRESETPKHATGGFTFGETTYIAGEDGKEWIAPNWMVSHPYTGRIITGLENMRRNPVSVTHQAYELSKSVKLSEMNPNINTTTTNGSGSIQQQYYSDPELKAILSDTGKAIKQLMLWKPKVYSELIKKDIEMLDDIQKNRGLY